MPLYILSPKAPYLLGVFVMFLAIVFVFFNSRHQWIRKKGYRKLPTKTIDDSLDIG
jgi:hypothetical protein